MKWIPDSGHYTSHGNDDQKNLVGSITTELCSLYTAVYRHARSLAAHKC